MKRALPLFFSLLAGFTVAVAAAPAKPAELDAPIRVKSRGPQWKNLKELEALANKGDPDACFEWGERLLNGDEVPADPARSVAYFEKAAKGGIDNAWFRLGKMYHDGTGVPRDYGKALEYLSEAARRGVPEAQYNIGAMLVSARGVKRDMVEGLAWFIVATKSGASGPAESQVRERLARRPADIAAAEKRAQEIEQAIAQHQDVAPVAIVKGAPVTPFSPEVAPPTPVVPPSQTKITIPVEPLPAPKPTP